MLVNPKGKYPRRKSLQIVFPKPVKHMKVNPSAIDRVKEAGKGLMGDVTIKEVAGGVGGVGLNSAIPQAQRLEGRCRLRRGGSRWWIAGKTGRFGRR
ncbi:MAG: hypothetical protein FIB08_15530 [Candidatus Methanoperedens sp.]|nr:hypothetical protein [Candidatus Methanoperedens sp.]